MKIVFESIYFFAPVYMANMAPVFAARLRWPGGRPVAVSLLGSHKTVRGFYAGILGAFLVLVIQNGLWRSSMLVDITLLHYGSHSILLLALLLGGGAMIGDMVGSFFKRRMGIPAGGCSMPLDQLDYVVGALLFVLPVVGIPWANIAVLLVLTPFLHIGVNIVGFWMGLKEVWW
ncbi:CDP-archaeol synthase [Candidatus Peregrinibacteria bacterium]|nr:CDP-archaeol synthase [Candidatus Peregrinibacteria bacterium]